MGDPRVDSARDKRSLFALLAVAAIAVLTVMVQVVQLFVSNPILPFGPLFLVSPVVLGLLTPALLSSLR
ncbi:hypothetical protein AAGW05_15855 [Arthrobacter sp. LAPM80]|uniref:hypothetical protein n=1 Tax=Arthrobacter sp. LAPM80 TaxID=3141788 RepID=UPI00398AF311